MQVEQTNDNLLALYHRCKLTCFFLNCRCLPYNIFRRPRKAPHMDPNTKEFHSQRTTDQSDQEIAAPSLPGGKGIEGLRQQIIG